MKTGPGYRYLEHQADMGIAGYGRTLREAFEAAAAGLLDLIRKDAVLSEKISVEITCEAADIPALLVAFLNEIIAQMDIHECLFSSCRILNLDENGFRLQAVLKGQLLQECTDKHLLGSEVKAATYCGLQVTRGKNGLYEARCVVDM